jgi:hypothetical protein
MGQTLRSGLDSLPRKVSAKATLRGESAPKILGTEHLGPVIERAIALAGMNKDQASDAMGYSDASTISRWISGAENPHLTRLWSVKALRAGLLMALAESARDQVEVETVFKVRSATA